MGAHPSNGVDVVTFGCRLNSSESEAMRAQAEAAGAAAFVEKQCVEPTLLTAIRQAAGKPD